MSKDKIKILHIQVLPKMSGVQRVSLELFKAMPKDWEKYVLFSSDIPVKDRVQCDTEFRNAGVKIIYSDNLGREISLRDYRAVKEIYTLCKKEKFDIVHTNSTKPGIVGRIAATLAGTPIVIHTVHGLSFHKFIKFPKWQFYRGCELFASLFCDKIISVNKYYLRYFKLFKKKTFTIYNGVDINKFGNDQNLNRPTSDGKSLIFVGRFDLPKDPLTLLKAIAIVKQTIPDIHLTMVGDGEYYEDCAKFIKENELTENVTLAGWQPDPSTYYRKSDIFVSSSIYEAFGLTFVEAGLHHLPVVTTNVEGIPEVVKENVTGLLCNPKDPHSLAKNILTLVNDPHLRKQFGNNAYDWCRENFDEKNMAQSYMKLYDQMISKNLSTK